MSKDWNATAVIAEAGVFADKIRHINVQWGNGWNKAASSNIGSLTAVGYFYGMCLSFESGVTSRFSSILSYLKAVTLHAFWWLLASLPELAVAVFYACRVVSS